MFLLLLCVTMSFVPVGSTAERNDAPIIGVLAQDLYQPAPGRSSYIAASYVKFLESAGARVVPVRINQTEKQYRALFNSINGVLYPGGGADIVSSGYGRAAGIFYKLAVEANLRGDFFPVWGTCLGFEELTYLTSGKVLLSHTNTSGVSLPLSFTNESRASRMFSGFPAYLLEAMGTKPLTENSHSWSITTKNFNDNPELKVFYKVLSTNTDGRTEFVSTVEGYDLPIYGTQWHPEKNAFEWKRPYIAHSPSAVRLTFFMADFFVSEARKSSHTFDSEEEERNALIYNHRPEAAAPKSIFEQLYYF